jgi:NADH:ubiquinone oxidoreductase subunit E
MCAAPSLGLMNDARVSEAVAALLDQAAYPKNAHYALAALQDVRGAFGQVPPEAVAVIAERLGMEAAAVAGLMRDSAQFIDRTAAHQLSICQGAVCIGKGGAELLAEMRRAFADRAGLQVVAGHCLGHCTEAPSASLDGDVLAPADATAIRRKVDSLD